MSRRNHFALCWCAWLALSPTAAFAQNQCAAPQGYSPPNCQAPSGYSPPSCTTSCTTSCRPPQGFTPPQQPPPSQPPMGFFQAPPPVGSVQGPVERMGVQGAEITFPELRLRLPSIKFPSKFHSRTNAHMVTESGIAPYVEGQNVAMGVSVHPTFPQGAPTPQRPPSGLTPPQPPCDQAVPYQGGPYQGGPGSCVQPLSGNYGPASEQQLAARLDTLERERMALQQRLSTLQSALEHAQQPPREMYPPVRPPVSALPPQPVAFAQQAAYLAEPARLPPDLGVIREPAAPTARISGLRPR